MYVIQHTFYWKAIKFTDCGESGNRLEILIDSHPYVDFQQSTQMG